jgi:hypothetical protein
MMHGSNSGSYIQQITIEAAIVIFLLTGEFIKKPIKSVVRTQRRYSECLRGMEISFRMGIIHPLIQIKSVQ